MTAAGPNQLKRENELLRRWVEMDAECPCCSELAKCDAECTYATDCPEEVGKMIATREFLANL